MAKFHKLKAPKGTDEANVANVSYKVDDNGEVTVPDEAVAPLLAVGGFTEGDQSDDDPDGSVTIKSTLGHTGCSWGGESFEPDDDGFFTVPAVAVGDLSAHGFAVAERPAQAKPGLKVPKL